ncbi:AAA family ATPase [Calothrix sp. CCY 0018]|uniref:trifunctional serine/threonine-protein kinase/ATP-binding protein/sensor histidine kinase n=1 Tax=Calothrix sp. CCY 0018 TaxID=3103864 RepID=UPI0039C743B7
MASPTVKLPGYKIEEQIYTSARTLVFRGKRESDEASVIVKVMRDDFPSFNELVSFRNQYIVTKNLNLDGIVKPLFLETDRNGYALVMEDFGGISLLDYLTLEEALQIISLDTFLSIATEIAKILDSLHRHRLIHKDIKPANILIQPDTKQVKLIDFSIASLLPRETQQLKNPNILEGTLAYISPEQTGRMNRGIDYRTDFYSLGITFYELLTGKLPFSGEDPIELVHSHIAKQAVNVKVINPKIPSVLSDIVAKLMAKNPEERYQTALGLKYDLEICAQAWKETGNIARFELGTRDISDRFIIPEKLYGREAEVATLLAAFDRIAGEELLIENQSPIEMVLVTGFSGIGKTAVVNEVHKPIVERRGYFIKGKYDQFNRHLPFSAFLEAFRDLMRQLLGESSSQVQVWKANILNALGENGQIIIDVIPELEQIIGKQPLPVELSGNEAQNRFNLLVQKFLQVFSSHKHPLVIFLDDLQWADSASLNLIQLMMSEADTKHLLLIGAYRDNEVSRSHPLIKILKTISLNGATINTIPLSPLEKKDLNNIVVDTLQCSEALTFPLTDLIYQKTKGNPFFSNQFLKSLHQDGLITFNHNSDSSQSGWVCDIVALQELALTDDVVEFIALQLHKLPIQTQEILKLAACIGNQFDLNSLSIISEKYQVETAADLWKALQEGLILPTTEVYKFFQSEDANNNENLALSGEQLSVQYKFLHDRIQQAAYSLIPDEDKKHTHIKIGKLLLENTSETEKEEKIFDIVNHLNYGIELIYHAVERKKLAHLNLLAGIKAKKSTAYMAANEYLSIAMSLLNENSWQEQYFLSFNLHRERAEAEYLNGNFDVSEQIINSAISQVKTNVEKAELYNILVVQYTVDAKCLDSIKVGREALKELGISLPSRNLDAELQADFQQVTDLLDGREISSLLSLSQMQDAEKIIASKILMNLDPATYIGQVELYPIVSLKLVALSLKYGNISESAKGYSNYGILLGSVLQNYKSGYEFGLLGVNVSNNFNNPSLKCKTYFIFAAFINHWFKHIKLTNKLFDEAYQFGLDAGELQFTGYTLFGKALNLFNQGVNLTDISSELPVLLEFNIKTKNQAMIDTLTAYEFILHNLRGMTASISEFSTSDISEKQYLQRCQTNQSWMAICCYQIMKSQVLFTYGKYQESLNCVLSAKEYLPYVMGFFVTAVHNLYYSLNLIQSYATENRQEIKNQYLQQLQENQKQMKIWADNCPENFLHKYLLVEAEFYRVSDDKLSAIELYDRAIALAKENGYVHEEALANELAAKFYLEWGKNQIAQVYITNAYYAYARWGAKAKVNNLEQSYPQLLTSVLATKTTTIQAKETIFLTSASTSTVAGSSVLDLSTAIKASRVISSEIQLDKLLGVLMQVVLENAGAQKGALILDKNGTLFIEAIATVDETEKYNQPTLQLSLAVEESTEVPISVLNYVKNSQECLVVDNATKDKSIMGDFYIQSYQPLSMLCFPILHQGKLIGLLYLENRSIPGAFTTARVELLNLLCSQAAISLQNAQLYHQAQNYAKQLEFSLDDLKQMQLQLVQSEKMSALGSLVAGIAHEINNPISFIGGNIKVANEFVTDLFDLINLYQNHYPDPVKEITKEIEAIDLEYLYEDLPKLIASMQQGVDRLYDLSISLRTFSRADTQKKVDCNIHDCINSTLTILKHRLKASNNQPEIEIVKDYADLPSLKCFPGQLSQVFMNIISNAIDALEESNSGLRFEEIQANPNRITITTSLIVKNNQISIRVKDNGAGMTEEVRNSIFEYLYTTKPVGKGTGLGLSIVHQIIFEKHNGSIEVNSAPGEGAEFIINLPL